MTKVTTKTADLLTLKGKLYQTQDRKHLIIHIPGMVGDIYNSGFYQVMKTEFPKQNIAFLATEVRASLHKKTLGENLTIEKFEECILDIDAWINYAHTLNYKNIWISSSSLGTTKVVHWYYTRKPQNISGLIFLSPSDMVGLVHDPEGIIDHNIMLPQAKRLINHGRPDQELNHKLWGIKRLTAQAYLSLFGENSQADIFNYRNPQHNWTKVNSINIPVLAFTGTNDDGIYPVIDIYQAMNILKQKLINSPKSKEVIYKGADHDFVGFEKHLVKDIVEFII